MILYLANQHNPDDIKCEDYAMEEEKRRHDNSPDHKSILRRKWSIGYPQQKTSALLSDHDIHGDDEAGVEVNKDVPVDVKDGGMMLDGNGNQSYNREISGYKIYKY